MGKGFEVGDRSGGDRGAGDDVGGGVRDVEEGKVLNVVKGGPDELWRWGARRGSNRRGGVIGVGVQAGVIPGVEV